MRTPLVLSLNPAVDAEWRVDRVRWEEKNVLESETRWAGGKGINVARWLRHLGSFLSPVSVSPSATQWGRGLGGGGAFARSPGFTDGSVRLLLPLGGELGHGFARRLAAEKFERNHHSNPRRFENQRRRHHGGRQPDSLQSARTRAVPR